MSLKDNFKDNMNKASNFKGDFRKAWDKGGSNRKYIIITIGLLIAVILNTFGIIPRYVELGLVGVVSVYYLYMYIKEHRDDESTLN